MVARDARKKKKSLLVFACSAEGPLDENSSLGPFLYSPEEEEVFLLFKNQVEVFLQNLCIEKNRIEEYLAKIEMFLKIPFVSFFRSLSTPSQRFLLTANFFLEHAETVHDGFASFLKNIEQSTGGRSEILDTAFRVVHHIQPKFDGGTDEESNCVLLHQYEHALIHLFRFLCFKNSRDFNAFSSACLTVDQIQRRNKGTLETQNIARQKTVLNPEWQATSGRKGVERSAELRRGKSNASALSRRANAETGRMFQFQNSRKRVHPWTWFLCELPLTFTNEKCREHIELVPHTNPTNRTVTYIVSTLKRMFPQSSIPETSERYSNFAELFRFEKGSYWGWMLVGFQIDGLFFGFETLEKKKHFYAFFATLFYAFYRSHDGSLVPLTGEQKQLLKERLLSFFQPLLNCSCDDLSILYEEIEHFLEFYQENVPVGSTANAKIVTDVHQGAKKDLLPFF